MTSPTHLQTQKIRTVFIYLSNVKVCNSAKPDVKNCFTYSTVRACLDLLISSHLVSNFRVP